MNERWFRQQDQKKRRRELMRSAIFDCRSGNYAEFSIIKTYVETYGVTTLYDNYLVKPQDYETWLQNSQK